MLAACLANQERGDPCWLLLVGGSGAGKTERLMALNGRPNVRMASSISGEAALLSGTGKKDRAADATGGLLNQLPLEGGILVIKDFTTILSMSYDKRTELLAALREIHDGSWVRHLGVEGGTTRQWRGKLGVIAGCTSAIDSSSSVMNTMGPRFIQVRLYGDPNTSAASAVAGAGHETEMRKALKDAANRILDAPPGAAFDETAAVVPRIIGMAKFVALARSTVERDYRHEVTLVHDAESPSRLAKQLIGLWRGARLLGLAEHDAWDLLWRASLDSLTKLRRVCLAFLTAQGGTATTTEIVAFTRHPRQPVRRVLDDLRVHGVVSCIEDKKGEAFSWELTERTREWLNEAGVMLGHGNAIVTVVAPPVLDEIKPASGNGHAHDFFDEQFAEQSPPPALDELPPLDWLLDAAEPPLEEPYYLELYAEPEGSFEPAPEPPDES